LKLAKCNKIHQFCQGFGNKQITLYDIRNELNERYNDVRTPYKTPNPEELFNMLTKETPETLYIGKLVTASVVGRILFNYLYQISD